MLLRQTPNWFYAIAARASAFRSPSFAPIQQLIGHVSNHDNQYQCGQPLLQFGMVAATPITSPMVKNHNTCFDAFRGANFAHIHAQKIETITKHPVLAISAGFEGMCPFTKSPGNSRESNGSEQSTSAIESK